MTVGSCHPIPSKTKEPQTRGGEVLSERKHEADKPGWHYYKPSVFFHVVRQSKMIGKAGV